MPHDGSRIEPRLELDDFDRQIARTAMPPRRRPEPDEFDRELARAKIPPKRPAPSEPDYDADTIRFERVPLSYSPPRARQSMVPTLLMLVAIGAAAATLALYLG